MSGVIDIAEFLCWMRDMHELENDKWRPREGPPFAVF